MDAQSSTHEDIQLQRIYGVVVAEPPVAAPPLPAAEPLATGTRQPGVLPAAGTPLAGTPEYCGAQLQGAP
jgi:hypothetical protein